MASDNCRGCNCGAATNLNIQRWRRSGDRGPNWKAAPSPNRADFACECQIAGLGESRVRRIYGLDAFQSLQLTLRFISTMLNHHREEAQGRIYWQEPGDDMGFVEVDPSPTSGK